MTDLMQRVFPLSDEELRRKAPSVFTGARSGKVSDRYRFIPTYKVIDIIRSQGWYPVSASEKRVILEENQGYQTHLIRFRQSESFSAAYQDLTPEIILLNNHNGEGCYRLHAGVFRLVCLNGLVVGDSLIPGVSVRHINISEPEVIAATFQIADHLPKMLRSVPEMRRIRLRLNERRKIQSAAVSKRWPVTGEKPPLPDDIFLKPQRPEDKPNDLWTVLNVVQENAVKGVDYYDPCKGAERKLRKLTSIEKIVDVNKAVWEEAETLRNKKAG